MAKMKTPTDVVEMPKETAEALFRAGRAIAKIIFDDGDEERSRRSYWSLADQLEIVVCQLREDVGPRFSGAAAGMTTRHRQLNLIIQRVPIVPGNPFDGRGARIRAVRNEVEAGTGQLFAVNESRYTVRQEPAEAWAIGDTIIDEDGQRRQVKGVAQLQQHGGMDGRMLQLLVEGHGGL